MNYGKEFQKYAMSDHKNSSLEMDQYGELVKGSMTPYILEEREMRATRDHGESGRDWRSSSQHCN